MQMPIITALGMAISLGCTSAVAQAYPVKPVRIVLPFPAGGTADVVARMIGSRMSEQVGQPVIVDNRVGAGGLIGANFVAKAAADGYMLLLTTGSTQVTPVFLSKNLPYDPVRDFTPVTAAVESFQGLVVSASLPIRSLHELIQYAKHYPGRLTYSSAGVGTEFHMVGELFKEAAGIDLLHVPYKGAAQALTDVATGTVSMTFATVAAERPFLHSGKARLLGILNAQRFPSEPGVPTIKEVLPSFERPRSWQGFFGPASLPTPLVERIYAEVKSALNAPDVRAQLEESGQRSIAEGPEEFAALLARNREDYARAVKIAGLKPE